MTDPILQIIDATGKATANRFKNSEQLAKSFAALVARNTDGKTVIQIERDFEAHTYVVVSKDGPAEVNEAALWATPELREILAQNFYMKAPINDMITWDEAKSHALNFPLQINATLVEQAYRDADHTIKNSY